MATSYANNAGTGERRPEIVVSSNIVSSAGDIGAGSSYSADQLGIFVDGIQSGSIGNGNPSREPGNGNNGLDRNLTFDFGVGASIVIDEFKIYLSSTTNYGTWTFEGSNNGSAWTTIGASFTLQGSGGSQTVARTNSTGYRYYRLHTTSFQNGGGGSGNWSEIEFKIEDTTPQASRCSWFNSGGQGNRGASITITSTATFGTGTIDNAIDGGFNNNGTDALAFTAGQSSKEIKFDFGVGATVVIDTVAIWLAAAAGNNNGQWKLAGSNDDSSYTDLESASDLTPTTNGYKVAKRTVANTTAYRYYKLIQTGGTTAATPVITEIEFRISGVGGGGGGGGTAQPVVIICTGG